MEVLNTLYAFLLLLFGTRKALGVTFILYYEPLFTIHIVSTNVIHEDRGRPTVSVRVDALLSGACTCDIPLINK
jgi:hypothetical protein